MNPFVMFAHWWAGDSQPAGAAWLASWIIYHHWMGEPTTRAEAVHISLAEGYTGGIPYNFVITRAGDVWEGRPVGDCAANLGLNRQAIAICFLGNFQVQEPTKAQMYAAAALNRRLLLTHKRAKVILHRDVNKLVPFAYYRGRLVSTATACPGDLFVKGRFGAILWRMTNGLSMEEADKVVWAK